MYIRLTSLLLLATASLGGCQLTMPKQTPMQQLPTPLTPPAPVPDQKEPAKEGATAAAAGKADAGNQATHLTNAKTALVDTGAAVEQAKVAATAAGPAAAAVLPPLLVASIKAALAKQEVEAAVPSADQYLKLSQRTQDLADRLGMTDDAVRERDSTIKQAALDAAELTRQVKARQAELEDIRTVAGLATDAAPGDAKHAIIAAKKTLQDVSGELHDTQVTWETLTAGLQLQKNATAEDILKMFRQERESRIAAESTTFRWIIGSALVLMVVCMAAVIWAPLIRGYALSLVLILGVVVSGAIAGLRWIAWCDDNWVLLGRIAGAAVVVGVGWTAYLVHRKNLSSLTLKGIVAGVETAANHDSADIQQAAAAVKTQISAQFKPGSVGRLEVDRIRHQVAAEATKGEGFLKRALGRTIGTSKPVGV